MPVVSTAGRFDNAPAHVIIVSTRFNPRELGTVHSENEKPRGSRKDQEARRIEKANAAIIKQDLRKAREAIERLQKMELSRKHQREAKAKKRQERTSPMLNTTPAKRETWIKAYPPIPSKKVHSKKQRAIETIRERERRAKIRAELIAQTLPAGYVLAETVHVVSSRNAVVVALRTGAVPSMRFGIKWYCDPAALQAHCVIVERNRLAALAMGRAKIAAMRKAKK